MDLAEATVHKVGNQLHVTHGDDAQLHVEFEMEAVHQPFESEQAGHPIYKNVPYIRILFPNDRTKQVYRPAKLKTDESSPSDCERFARQWGAFEKQETQSPEGTPLEKWPMVTKADVRMLKERNLHTVEQVAGMGDGSLDFLGARMYRDKAKGWLDSLIDGATLSKALHRNAELEVEVKRQADVINDLGAGMKRMEAQLAALSASEKPSRKAA